MPILIDHDFLDDPGEGRSDEHTIADALCDIAVEHCRQRDQAIRPEHVKARFLHDLNDSQALGKAIAAAKRREEEDDKRWNDWQRAMAGWARDFYVRLARERDWQMSEASFRIGRRCFATSFAYYVGPLESWCLNAGQQERAPVLGEPLTRDPLLTELNSGKAR